MIVPSANRFRGLLDRPDLIPRLQSNIQILSDDPSPGIARGKSQRKRKERGLTVRGCYGAEPRVVVRA